MVGLFAVLLLAFLLAAAVWDLRHREIPDVFPIGILLLAAAAAATGALPWSAALVGLVACALVSVALFAVGAWGGGDAKLATAIGAAIGFPAVLSSLFFAALAGGVLAAVASVRGEREVAYGPALAAGVALAMAIP